MSAPAYGWWVDVHGLAHFYDSAEELAAEIAMVYPTCGAENRENTDPRDYLFFPEETEARSFVDMGPARGQPCPECLHVLTQPPPPPARGDEGG